MRAARGQAGGGDVLAELSRSEHQASIHEGCEELGWDHVNVPQIGEAGLATGEIAVPDERAGVGIAVDAMAFQQDEVITRRFAEVVTVTALDLRDP